MNTHVLLQSCDSPISVYVRPGSSTDGTVGRSPAPNCWGLDHMDTPIKKLPSTRIGLLATQDISIRLACHEFLSKNSSVGSSVVAARTDSMNKFSDLLRLRSNHTVIARVASEVASVAKPTRATQSTFKSSSQVSGTAMPDSSSVEEAGAAGGASSPSAADREGGVL